MPLAGARESAGTEGERSAHPPSDVEGGALLQTYIVESYTPPSRANDAGRAESLARAVAELVREGVEVEHRRTTFLADDDTCFYLVAAHSQAAVDELCRRAGIGHVRIVRAVET